MNFTIRIALPPDKPILARFALATAAESENLILDPVVVERGVATMLKSSQMGFYLVAEVQTDAGVQVVACTMVTYEWSDWRNADIWWIQSVYTLPEWRGKGAFAALHAEVLQRAQAAGAAAVRLYAYTGNARAHKAYEKLGMKSGHYIIFDQIEGFTAHKG